MNKRKALGVGTSAAGGAATGSVFGPVGAGIGGAVGLGLGLLGGLDNSEEEALKKQRDRAKESLVLELYRNRAAKLGADTTPLDVDLQLRDIDQRYEDGMAGLDDVNPQDIMGLAQSVASIGKNAGDWGGDADLDDLADDLPSPPKRTADDLTRSDRGILMTTARRRG